MGELVGANPVDHGKPGSKYHLVIDANGIPLIVTALLHLGCALICARKLHPW